MSAGDAVITVFPVGTARVSSVAAATVMQMGRCQRAVVTSPAGNVSVKHLSSDRTATHASTATTGQSVFIQVIDIIIIINIFNVA